MPLPQSFLNELHDRSDIVELINSYTPLKKRGRIHWALCPFHNEKTPSFAVYEDTSSFYCFGCGTGGDAITFIKLKENLEYIEAVRFLAQRAGLPMPEDADEGAFARRRRLLDVNREAARFFFRALNSEEGREARAYLRRRGLDNSTIKRFGIGYAPEGWGALREEMHRLGYRDEELLAAGLCSKSQKNDSVFDFFRNRAMFPIIDVRGSVVAFSGRALDDDKRKYLNTPDTPVFKKSRTVYALNIAKGTDTRQILLCEGQMDVIALHRAGFTNAVAACGTALTDEQARMIGQYADEVVLCYDSDEAGRKAARRAIDIFSKTALGVRVLEYTGAKDPDEYIAKYGAESFAQLLEGADNSTEYSLSLISRNCDMESDAGRVEYLKQAVSLLAKCPTPVERDLFAGRVAEQTTVSKGAVLEQIERERKRASFAKRNREKLVFARTGGGRWDISKIDRSKLGEASAGRRLLALLFARPELANRVSGRVHGGDFVSADEGAVFEALCSLAERGELAGLQSLSPLLSDAQISLLSGLIAESSGVNFSASDADFLIDKLVRARDGPSAGQIKEMDALELQGLIEKNRKPKGEE
ncbi:MAG: DNA primase [Oscillospiraceae bacterium]|nr:DNA primase [Oscillospiraceae bacterium]